MRHSRMGSPASRTVWYAGVLSHCFSESWTATRTCPLGDAGSLMRITNVLVSAADATAHQLIPSRITPMILRAPIFSSLMGGVSVSEFPRHMLKACGCQFLREHGPVMAVPVALEPLLWIVLQLAPQELQKLRVGAEHLVLPRPAVVRQVVGAAETQGAIDDALKVPLGLSESFRRMLDAQVKDGARVVLLRPGQEALFIPLDEPHCAVDDIKLLGPRILDESLAELLKPLAWHVHLGDH